MAGRLGSAASKIDRVSDRFLDAALFHFARSFECDQGRSA